MADRAAAIRARIAALRAKTTRNGCTEAEALAAAELAARLMQDHGLADDEMEEAVSPERASKPSWRDVVDMTIGRCTNTAVLLNVGTGVLFIGRAPGPGIAAYLRDVVVRAIVGELAAFRKSPFYRRRRSLRTKKQATSDFAQGIAGRICMRLLEMFKPTMNPALGKAARAARDARYPGAQSVEIALKDSHFGEAFSAGVHAGDRVPINHGVAGSRAPAEPVPRPAAKLPAPPRQGSLF